MSASTQTNKSSGDKYAGIAKGNSVDGGWGEPSELFVAFTTVMSSGQITNYALPAGALARKIERIIIGTDKDISLTEAFRAAQAIKQAGEDIKAGKIRFEDLPSWHTSGAADRLYHPKISAPK